MKSGPYNKNWWFLQDEWVVKHKQRFKLLDLVYITKKTDRPKNTDKDIAT